MSDIIRVSDLTKYFGKELKPLTGSLSPFLAGRYMAFLGKTGQVNLLLYRMLLTLIRPSSGEIEIFGMDLAKHRKEILQKTGAIIERPDLYKYLTALENLRIFAAMSGVTVSEKKLMDQLEMVVWQKGLIAK